MKQNHRACVAESSMACNAAETLSTKKVHFFPKNIDTIYARSVG
jgi:hypothetical protein